MRCEYSRGWVWEDEEKGTGRWVRSRGQEHRMDEYLRRMGDDGWELVGAVVGQSWGSGAAAPAWYSPSHWLYFKRPKSS